MKRILILIQLTLLTLICSAQYNKEKITSILTDQKTWSVTGLNTEPSEKTFSFNIDNTVNIEQNNGAKKSEKWSLKTTDEIRWFISIGSQMFELIISYDKRGKQYIKLTRQSVDNKTSGYYEIKLLPKK